MSEAAAGAMELIIITPTERAVDERIREVRLPGLDGELDILPGHCELVVALGRGDIVFIASGSGEEETLAIGGGQAEIRPDRITVFADAPPESGTGE